MDQDETSAAVYVRVSTEEQGDRNLSLPAQLEACRDFIEERGWAEGGVYADVASGKTDQRREFQRMAADAKQRRFQAVVVYKYSRFGRNLVDSVVYERELREAGVTLVSATEPYDPDTVWGYAAKVMMQLFAEVENRQKAEFVRAGMRQLLEQGGWPWGAPLGYANRREQLDAKHVRKWVEPDEETAPLVRRAFELAALGELSLSAICDELTRLGLRSRAGNPLTPQTLLWLLRNEFYAGVVSSEKFDVRVRGVHEPLVTAELFERVQAALGVRRRAPRRAPKRPFALRGLLFCACGWRVAMDGPHKGKHTYLHCMSYVNKRREGCHRHLARMDQIICSSRGGPPALYVDAADVEAVGELWPERRQEGRVEEELPAWRPGWPAPAGGDALLDLRLDRELDRDEYERKRRSLDREIGIMSARQAELEARRRERAANVDTVLRVANSLPRLWAEADEVERGELLRCVFERLIVGEGRIVNAVLREPFRLLEGRWALAPHRPKKRRAPEEVTSA
jgi:DNA invertase Pin-like site-specific DNA recombinase